MGNQMNNPHDKFFKAMMAEKDIAIDFLKKFLPVEISSLIDFQSISLEKNSFLNEELSELFADSIIKCKILGTKNAQLYLSVLIEHKSYPDKYVAVQILSYLSNAYLSQLKAGEKTLYPVIPLIFYHGEQEWQFKPLSNLFEDVADDLKKYIPEFKTEFVDLVRKSEVELDSIENIFLLSALYIQKYRTDKDLFDKLEKIMSKFDSIRQRKRNFSNSMFVYVFEVTSITQQELIILIERFPNRIKSEIMTTYEIIEQKGIEKGIEKEKIEVILKGYRKGISLSDLSDITRLPIEKVKVIIEKDLK